jgi:hypothetical protein
MHAVQPKSRRAGRGASRNADQSLYQWSLTAAVIAVAAYATLAIATLGDTVDGLPVSAIDAAWPYWAGTIAVALIAGVLAQVVIQTARPRLPARADARHLPSIEDQRRGNLAWVLPSLTAIASVLLVRLYHTPLAATIGGILVFVATTATIVAHYHLRDERDTRRNAASVSLLLFTHAVAFLLLIVIYSNKWRSLYSATAIALATALMLLQLTDGEEIAWLRRLLYALVGGLLIGEMTWALNFWAAVGWTGGVMLLVLFYFIAGTSLHAIRGKLGRREVLEYIIVTGLAAGIITFSVTNSR